MTHPGGALLTYLLLASQAASGEVPGSYAELSAKS